MVAETEKIPNDLQTWSYSVDPALYHHRGTLAATKLTTWLISSSSTVSPGLVFPRTLPSVDSRNPWKNGTYDISLVTFRVDLVSSFVECDWGGFMGVSGFLRIESEVILTTVGGTERGSCASSYSCPPLVGSPSHRHCS